MRPRTIFIRSDGRLRAGWRLVLFVVALVAAGLALSVVVRLLHVPPLRAEDGVVIPASLLIRGLLGLASILGVSMLCLRLLEKRPLSSVGLPSNACWKDLGLGLLLGAAPIVLLVASLAAAGHAEVALAWPATTDLLTTWLPMTIGLALVSSQEELLLRGYGLQTLADGGGRWFAAILTGVLFGAMHAGNPGANALGILNTGANAILLAWLVMRTGSLWIACSYHAGWNLTGAMVFGMRLSGMNATGGLLVTHLTGPDWLSGGSYGFEGSAIIGILELIVLSIGVALVPRLTRHHEILQHYPSLRGAASGPPPSLP